MAVKLEDLKKGQIFSVHDQGNTITPQVVQVEIYWVAPDQIHYTKKGERYVWSTSIERFLDIVNKSGNKILDPWQSVILRPTMQQAAQIEDHLLVRCIGTARVLSGKPIYEYVYKGLKFKVEGDNGPETGDWLVKEGDTIELYHKEAFDLKFQEVTK